jgi:ribosome-binding factor A
MVKTYFLPPAICLLPPVFMRRPERIAEMLREEISEIVSYELDDPRVQTVTVTDVRVADNFRDARVFVLVEGEEHEKEVALVALRHAAPYIRKQVALSMNLRHAPHIHFVRDTVEERAARVDMLLEEIEQGWEKEKGKD